MADLGLGWSVVVGDDVDDCYCSEQVIVSSIPSRIAEIRLAVSTTVMVVWRVGCGQPSFSLCRLALSSTIIPG